MTVYVDGVLALNFAINFLLLRGAGRLGGAGLRPLPLCLGAAVGAVYAFLTYPLPALGLWPFRILCAGIMVVLAFGLRREALRLGALFGVLSLVLSGAVYGIQALLGRHPMGAGLLYPVSFGTLLLTAGAVSAACRLLLPRLTHAPDSIVPLTLSVGPRQVRLTALRDSGNTLRDPVSGTEVLVAGAPWAGKLLGLPLGKKELQAPEALALELASLRPRLIPFRAVGVESGLLLAVPCTICQEGKTRRGLVAFAPGPISDGGAYDALMGGGR